MAGAGVGHAIRSVIGATSCCSNITLNVWEGNAPARSFYEAMGLHVQKTTMEEIL